MILQGQALPSILGVTLTVDTLYGMFRSPQVEMQIKTVIRRSNSITPLNDGTKIRNIYI